MCEIGKKRRVHKHNIIEKSMRRGGRFSKNESDHVKWYELVLIMWTYSECRRVRLLSQLIDKSVYEEEWFNNL